MTATHSWYQIENIQQVDSPALVIYPERVKENIRLLVSMVDDPLRLRPHIKTNKSKEAIRLLMGAGIQKFKCATIAEAELLGQAGARDVLLAYQPVGPKLERYLELVAKFPSTSYSCLTDNTETANAIAAAFAARGLKTGICLDINPGQNRTGIAPGREAIQLYILCTRLAGIVIKGLHAYDGHLRQKDFTERTTACNKAFEQVEHLRNELIKMNYAEPVIVAGGSPTFPIHAKRSKIECSPGTFIYWDKGYSDLCPEQPFIPAALVISRVISLPAPGFICTDLGHKSIASENEISRRVHFLNASNLEAVSQSEEHLVLKTGPNHTFKPGDVLYGVPIHICPTVALYERAVTVENGRAYGEWKIAARDRKLSV